MKSALIFYYTKNNRYSYNALIAALEKYEIIEKVDIFLCPDEKEIIATLNYCKKFYKKIIITISFFTTQIWEVEKLLKNIEKLKITNIIKIAGGPHPTGLPERTKNLGFEYVLAGEGEYSFPEYILKIIKNESLGDIFKSKKNVDLNEFNPFPVKKIKKFGPIEITRGCPYACKFCQTSWIFGTKVRHRSIEKICEIVNFMKENNRKDIRFITPNAFSYGSEDGRVINLYKIKLLLSEIRKILKNNGRIFFGSFPSEVRPEHVNEDTVALVKKYCDNNNLIIGAQSGSEKILKYCNRQHNVKDIYKAVKISVRYGLTPNVDFIFGLPGEDEKDIKDTVNVMKDLIKYGAKIHAHTFMPLPQTPFMKAKYGKISKLIFENFNYYIPKGLIFGNYHQQEKLSKKIYEYLKLTF